PTMITGNRIFCVSGSFTKPCMSWPRILPGSRVIATGAPYTRTLDLSSHHLFVRAHDFRANLVHELEREVGLFERDHRVMRLYARFTGHHAFDFAVGLLLEIVNLLDGVGEHFAERSPFALW